MPLPLPPQLDLDALLQSFAPQEIRLGHRRLQAALAAAGHPERRFAAVQVAGTNGKGSISTLVHSILRAAGLPAAAYRSPHLQSWCERLQLDDAWISPTQLRADLLHWRPLAEAHGLTIFEWLTAAAFGRCAAEAERQQLPPAQAAPAAGVPPARWPYLAVLEVGLGGRLDATTVHPDRAVVGFGAIGLDHREFLGSTLEAIAAEKAAVMSPGAVACSAAQHPAVAAVLEREARERGCTLRWLEPLASEDAGGPRLGLAGTVQRANGAVAVGMVQALAEQGWPISADAVATGLARAHWPGRLQRARWRGTPMLLDGAHNPPGAEVLARELALLAPAAPGQPRHWLLGIQRQKQAAEMLDALLQPQDRCALVPVPEAASWTVAELLAVRPALAGRLEAVADLDAGLAFLHPSPALPVVAGSLHLLGAVHPLLDPEP